ncbi:hypothetical protein [Micromonospora tulbaghiae]|uniref:hypothetical protein n=1 Tax=Micromonospora tulbaghiae TaxID=479978 RepID=UPI003678BAEA
MKNNSTLSVDVVNCWHDTSSGWTGNSLPPCASMYSLNSWNAAYWVNPGGLSTNLSNKYYDVDAFYARPGCVTSGHFSGGTTLHYDRRGRAGQWVRVYGTDTANINYVIC